MGDYVPHSYRRGIEIRAKRRKGMSESKSMISLRLISTAPVPNGFAVLSALLLMYGLGLHPLR